MIRLKVLSAAAVMALVLPFLVPQASLAQAPGHPGASRGGGNPGGGFRPGGGVRPGGGGPRSNGGGYRGGGYHGGGNGALIGGAIAGAVIGGAIASQGYGPGYYPPSPGYYDNGYGYDDAEVAVAPAPDGDDGVAYCMQTYRSYDPQSGTYLGYDGSRHPCP
jgi:hypothetical protein